MRRSQEWSSTGAGHRRFASSPPLSEISTRSSRFPAAQVFETCGEVPLPFHRAHRVNFVTQSLIASSRPPALLTVCNSAQVENVFRSTAQFGSNERRRSPRPISTFVACGAPDGGLQQDRAKRGGFGKDAGPVARLERTPNARDALPTSIRADQKQRLRGSPRSGPAARMHGLSKASTPP
jgi:hypothetical protein